MFSKFIKTIKAIGAAIKEALTSSPDKECPGCKCKTNFLTIIGTCQDCPSEGLYKRFS